MAKEGFWGCEDDIAVNETACCIFNLSIYFGFDDADGRERVAY